MTLYNIIKNTVVKTAFAAGCGLTGLVYSACGKGNDAELDGSCIGISDPKICSNIPDRNLRKQCKDFFKGKDVSEIVFCYDKPLSDASYDDIVGLDAYTPEAGQLDAYVPDAGHSLDAYVEEAGIDAGIDSGMPEEDAGFDAGEDVSFPDAYVPEAGALDAGVDGGIDASIDAGDPCADSGLVAKACKDENRDVDGKCKLITIGTSPPEASRCWNFGNNPPQERVYGKCGNPPFWAPGHDEKGTGSSGPIKEYKIGPAGEGENKLIYITTSGIIFQGYEISNLYTIVVKVLDENGCEDIDEQQVDVK